jgi:hypothetical protein
MSAPSDSQVFLCSYQQEIGKPLSARMDLPMRCTAGAHRQKLPVSPRRPRQSSTPNSLAFTRYVGHDNVSADNHLVEILLHRTNWKASSSALDDSWPIYRVRVSTEGADTFKLPNF